MNDDILKIRSYDLPDLSEEIKKIWHQSDNWRLFKGKIEFSITTSNDEIEWFPLYRAPEKVQEFVRSWVRSGGLSNQERKDF